MKKNRQGFDGQPAPKRVEGMSQYRPPLCYELGGRTLELVMDTGRDYVITFSDRKTLRFGEKGAEAAEYAYDCLKAEEDTYFVNFEVTGAQPRTGLSFVLDMEQSLVFGSTRILRKASLSSGLRYVSTGRRPIISGMRPNDFKS